MSFVLYKFLSAQNLPIVGEDLFHSVKSKYTTSFIINELNDKFSTFFSPYSCTIPRSWLSMRLQSPNYLPPGFFWCRFYSPHPPKSGLASQFFYFLFLHYGNEVKIYLMNNIKLSAHNILSASVQWYNTASSV